AWPLEIACEVALPAEREMARSDQMRRPGKEAAVLPARVEDLALRTVVVLRIAHVRLCEETGRAEAAAELHAQSLFGDARADGAEHPRGERRTRFDALRAGRDDAADGVGPVCDGSGPTRNLDTIEHTRIEVGGARSDAALGADATTVYQNESATGRETAHRRHARVSLRLLVDAGNVFERGDQVLRLPHADVPPGDRRHARRRRRVDVRRRAGDRDLFRYGRVESQLDRVTFDSLHEQGPGERAIGQDDQKLEWRTRHGCPREAAVGIRTNGTRLANDG